MTPTVQTMVTAYLDSVDVKLWVPKFYGILPEAKSYMKEEISLTETSPTS